MWITTQDGIFDLGSGWIYRLTLKADLWSHWICRKLRRVDLWSKQIWDPFSTSTSMSGPWNCLPLSRFSALSFLDNDYLITLVSFTCLYPFYVEIITSCKTICIPTILIIGMPTDIMHGNASHPRLAHKINDMIIDYRAVELSELCLVISTCPFSSNRPWNRLGYRHRNWPPPAVYVCASGRVWGGRHGRAALHQLRPTVAPPIVLRTLPPSGVLQYWVWKPAQSAAPAGVPGRPGRRAAAGQSTDSRCRAVQTSRLLRRWRTCAQSAQVGWLRSGGVI